MILYTPLIQTLKEKGMKKTDLLPYMSSATLAKISANKFISLRTINDICTILDCPIDKVVIFEKSD